MTAQSPHTKLTSSHVAITEITVANTKRFPQFSRKGGNTMKYAKPQIVLSGPAVVAIQSLRKPLGGAPDNGKFNGTMGAYEADE